MPVCLYSMSLNLSISFSSPSDPSFILLPLLSLHSPPPPSPSSLLHPITPYLDRSHDCCDTSWLTAHLHVFQLHSLVREMGGMEGPRSRWRGAEGLRESEVLWGNYGLSENIMKREKP